MDKTLEEQLLEEGFTARGPFAPSDLGEAINRIFVGESDPKYIQIIQGKLCRKDMDTYPELFMMYYK